MHVRVDVSQNKCAPLGTSTSDRKPVEKPTFTQHGTVSRMRNTHGNGYFGPPRPLPCQWQKASATAWFGWRQQGCSVHSSPKTHGLGKGVMRVRVRQCDEEANGKCLTASELLAALQTAKRRGSIEAAALHGDSDSRARWTVKPGPNTRRQASELRQQGLAQLEGSAESCQTIHW